MTNVKLKNGNLMPQLGYGEYLVDKAICVESTLNAFKLGYRHIDTAQIYLNEEEVGIAIKQSSLKRQDLFITTKVWVTEMGYEKATASIHKSLQKLQTSYVDLVLIHQPYGDYYGAWRALEEFYEQGIIKAIGVSNFSMERLADLLWHAKIKPMVNQIEINPLVQRKDAIQFCNENGVVVQAWSPLGGHSRVQEVLNNPTLMQIAKSKNKTVSQVILRWLIQQNIVVLVKSSNSQRMKENFEVFDFELSNEQMKQINQLDENKPKMDHTSIDGLNYIKSAVEKKK